MARTCDLLIKSQPTKKTNSIQSKDLQQSETCAYKPAYKQNPKTAENEPVALPSDLAEIVQVWPELPEHIKAAVRALRATVDASRYLADCGSKIRQKRQKILAILRWIW